MKLHYFLDEEKSVSDRIITIIGRRIGQLIVISLNAIPVTLIWNFVIIDIFSVPSITYLQAFCLYALVYCFIFVPVRNAITMS